MHDTLVPMNTRIGLGAAATVAGILLSIAVGMMLTHALLADRGGSDATAPPLVRFGHHHHLIPRH